MQLSKRLVVALSAVAIFAAGIVAAPPPETAYAQEDMAVTCADELNLTPPSEEEKGKAPQLVVHGRGSDGEIWAQGSPSMEDALRPIDNAVLVEPFDYASESTKWVANSDAAHRLAKTIVCYFLLYGEKVVVVGHSMGGLLSLEAFDWSAYGVHVRDAVGHFISIASPFEGSWLASTGFAFVIAFCEILVAPVGLAVDTDQLCREAHADWSSSGLSYDSDQLEALPDLPEGITHKAIAGRVQMEVCFFGCVPFSIGDGVVPSESATARYTDTGVGDGVTIFDCTISEGAWCAHSSMLQAEQVQQEVKASIEAYLTSLRGEIHEFYGLQLTMPPEWTVDTGPEAGYLYSEIQYHNQDYCPPGGRYCPLVTIFDNSTSKWQDLDTFHIEDGVLVEEYRCPVTAYQPPELIREVDIDGEVAQLYEHASCPEYADIPYTKRSWVILGKQMVITDQSGSDGSLSEGFDQILAEASWP